MRIAITTAALLTFFGSAVEAQQAFQIIDPDRSAASQAADSGYFAVPQTRQVTTPSYQVAARANRNSNEYGDAPAYDPRTRPQIPAAQISTQGDHFFQQASTAKIVDASPAPQYVEAAVEHDSNFGQPTSYRSPFFFGVDPDQCCDEWEGDCGCGGLKANPGHLGRKWLRDNDPCETTQRCGCRKSKVGKSECSSGCCNSCNRGRVGERTQKRCKKSCCK